LHAFNIATDNDNGSLSHTDIHRLLPALVHVKFNDGCTKAGGRATWKSKEKKMFFIIMLLF
jgi:hypothetical protein